jgi:hypothetical protein
MYQVDDRFHSLNTKIYLDGSLYTGPINGIGIKIMGGVTASAPHQVTWQVENLIHLLTGFRLLPQYWGRILGSFFYKAVSPSKIGPIAPY